MVRGDLSAQEVITVLHHDQRWVSSDLSAQEVITVLHHDQRWVSSDLSATLCQRLRFVSIDETVKRIMETGHFDIDCLPVDHGDGADVPAFNYETYQVAMSATPHRYTCTGNLQWVNHMYSTAPTVPILRSVVEDLADKFYLQRKGNMKPLHLTIAVDNLTMNPEKHLGALRCVSALEEVHAPYIALGKLLDKHLDAAQIAEWQ
eukprot:6492608-Amphidinium_carterae.1